MKEFFVFWQHDDVSQMKGVDIADAFRNAGYGGGAARAVDFWMEVKRGNDLLDQIEGLQLTNPDGAKQKEALTNFIVDEIVQLWKDSRQLSPKASNDVAMRLIAAKLYAEESLIHKWMVPVISTIQENINAAR